MDLPHRVERLLPNRARQRTGAQRRQAAQHGIDRRARLEDLIVTEFCTAVTIAPAFGITMVCPPAVHLHEQPGRSSHSAVCAMSRARLAVAGADTLAGVASGAGVPESIPVVGGGEIVFPDPFLHDVEGAADDFCVRHTARQQGRKVVSGPGACWR